MAKYKNLSPQLVEGFLAKMFGKILTKKAEKHIKDILKKDPKLGKILQRANNVAKEGEDYLKSMSKSEREKYMGDIYKDYGY